MVEFSSADRGKGVLTAKVIDEPEDEAEHQAKNDGSHQGEGDAPVAPPPGEVSRQPAKREVEPREDDERQSDDDQKKSKEYEHAAKVGHRRC